MYRCCVCVCFFLLLRVNENFIYTIYAREDAFVLYACLRVYTFNAIYLIHSSLCCVWVAATALQTGAVVVYHEFADAQSARERVV